MSMQHSTLSKGRNFTIESFDIVAVCGNKVEYVASTKSNVASTMLPVASTLLLVWTGLRLLQSSVILVTKTKNRLKIDGWTYLRQKMKPGV